MPARRAARASPYRVTASTAIGYQGRSLAPAAGAFIDHLTRALDAWERATGDRAFTFWERDAPTLAGQLGHLEARDGWVRPL
jgi:hypothetical protein